MGSLTPLDKFYAKVNDMDLLEVRTQFIELSGRHDLVEDTTDYKDNGADYYLNAAVRELDVEIMQTYKSSAILYDLLPAGDFFLSIPDCRTIDKVFIATDDKYYQLEWKAYNILRKTYAKNLDNVDSGQPRYFATVATRKAPSYEDLSDDDQSKIEDTTNVFGNVWRGIIIMPSPDQEVTVEVHGNFFSGSLSDDDDTNFWTDNYPDILIKGAIRELERSYRNRQGAEDLSMFIQEQMQKIDMDRVEDQTNRTSVMEG